MRVDLKISSAPSIEFVGEGLAPPGHFAQCEMTSPQGGDLVGAGDPVAVPGIFLRRRRSSENTDRCHSLGSLYLPPAALPSLPPTALTPPQR